LCGSEYGDILRPKAELCKRLLNLHGDARCGGAFTGARKGELRGFRWEDYDGKQLCISQAYWRSHRQEPKTRKSRAPVPIIKQLAATRLASRIPRESEQRFDVPRAHKETH
jgi:integrase